MQVATTPASLISLSTSSAGTSATDDEANLGVLKLQRATQALQQMRQTLASSVDEAKAKAQRKLEQAKQELEMLKSSNMPPEVVARLAAELARKVAAPPLNSRRRSRPAARQRLFRRMQLRILLERH